MLEAIASKAQKLAFANHKTVGCMTTKEFMQIEAIVTRCMKRIP